MKAKKYYVTRWVSTRGIVQCYLKKVSPEYASSGSDHADLFTIGKDAFLSQTAAKQQALVVLNRRKLRISMDQIRVLNQLEELGSL